MSGDEPCQSPPSAVTGCSGIFLGRRQGTRVDAPVEGPSCWVTVGKPCPWPPLDHTLSKEPTTLPNRDLELVKIYEVCASLRPPLPPRPPPWSSVPSETINRAFTCPTCALGQALGKGCTTSPPSPHSGLLRLQRRPREGERPAQDHTAAQQDQNVGPEDAQPPVILKTFFYGEC